MIETVKTLRCVDSHLYGAWDGTRHLLTDVDPVIEVRCDCREVRKSLGAQAARFKKTYAVLVLYGRIDAVQGLDDESIRRVENCILSATVVRGDGFAAEHFDTICLSPLDIELGERWEFVITDSSLVDKLIAM